MRGCERGAHPQEPRVQEPKSLIAKAPKRAWNREVLDFGEW